MYGLPVPGVSVKGGACETMGSSDAVTFMKLLNVKTVV